uniref:NADH-ubiquinone oxidoreductase chain 5 n=1 Tax=Russelliana solanicola TaxID=2008469 RepID=A0A344A2R7_9HEMI|nr:NADH dehydrogenase subunit 5 [Russelliana solanicola]AWU49058.1 NADH dehydrogenase subunit 5 [Russelliana solanicola]
MYSFSKFNFIAFFMGVLVMILSVIMMVVITLNKSVLLELELVMYNSVSFSFVLFFDWISMLFMLVVMLISALILVYGKSYMVEECYRFMWMTLFFIFFMMIMVLSPSVVGVLLGWDGLGIVSYCLVIYYQSFYSYNSGFITAATNRLGDSMLILTIIWSSMSGMFLFWEQFDGAMLLILACMTKSAQFPFSAWLPAAMAAPTPISSLVHSSTLVTAGVYLMIRFYQCFMSMQLLSVLLIVSLLTVMVAGMSALQEFDMKRLIALSTLGQLGFMVLILSLGYPSVAFFHLIIHALFKALLFMCAGLIIHSGGGAQDLRKLGSLSIDPITKVSLNISSFSLMGLPFSSGFYSKDSLLELTMCSYGGFGLGLFMLLMGLVTVAYTARLVSCFCTLSGWGVWESSCQNLSWPIGMLAFINIMAGSYINWMLMELHLICLGVPYKIMLLMILLLGIVWQGETILTKDLMITFTTLMFMSSLTKSVGFSYKISVIQFKLIDQGWLEGVMGSTKQMIKLSSLWMKNVLSNSTSVMSLGTIIIMIMII